MLKPISNFIMQFHAGLTLVIKKINVNKVFNRNDHVVHGEVCHCGVFNFNYWHTLSFDCLHGWKLFWNSSYIYITEVNHSRICWPDGNPKMGIKGGEGEL